MLVCPKILAGLIINIKSAEGKKRLNKPPHARICSNRVHLWEGEGNSYTNAAFPNVK